jgi:hypothetical protein
MTFHLTFELVSCICMLILGRIKVGAKIYTSILLSTKVNGQSP